MSNTRDEQHKGELLPDSRALAAVISTPVKSVSGPRPSLGKYVVGSGLCTWCHDHGFNGPQNRHAEAACPWKLRAQERLARKGKASAALVAEQGVDLAEHDVNAFLLIFGLCQQVRTVIFLLLLCVVLLHALVLLV